MGANLTGMLQRGLRTFGAFTLGQKAVTIVAVVALVLGGLLFSRWASAPTYAPMFSSLAPSDASAIVEKLNADGTPYQLADGGQTILVPKDAVYDTRLRMSGQGLPAGETTGYSLLDKGGLTSSEFQQHTQYRRALEGELTKTIEAIDGIDAAVVHIAMPEKDVFADDEQKPTASVLVDTAQGKNMSSQQVQAIVHLVSSSVEGLSPEDITLADSEGKVLSVPGEGGTLSSAGDARQQQTQAFEDRLSGSLQEMLDRVAGSGGSVVRVTADLDYDQTDTKTERFEAQRNVPPLAESSTRETYQGNGAAAGGVLGPDNTAVPRGTGTNSYTKESSTANNAVGKVTEQRKSAPGAVRRLNVAVLLDTKKAGAVDTTEVNRLVSSAVGINPQRGDTIEVSRMAFDTSAEDTAKKELVEAKQAEQRAGLMSMAKTAGLVVLVLLLIGAALLSSRRRRRSELTEEELLRIAALQKDFAVEAAGAKALEAAGPALAELTAAPAEPEIDPTAQVRDEIGAMVEQQPEEVAQLLRGWLADRRS